ncbi:MAG: GAF domain-containing sensor histidine kinase [Anaerolineales bacterium]|nr:GAF domain-containing sensor histidine kinase [Anaerolineales bacterium]
MADQIVKGEGEALRAEEMARQLWALREAALAVAGDLSLADTLRRIVMAAGQLANARYAALGVPDETGEYLAEFVTMGMTPEAEARVGHRPRGHGILGIILREGQSLRLKELRNHPRSVGFPPNHPPMKSFLGVPITRKGARLGNLYLTDKRDADEFSADDQHLIEMLAVHAGAAIENARLYSRVQHLSVVEERQRIGMDLHDGVIQSIYAVGLMLEFVRAQLDDGEVASAQERLGGAVEALNATIRDIRAYILDLRPRRFEGDNLVVGLERLLTEFKANTLISVTFAADSEVDADLRPEARLALFHIAQEALSNAAKHSRAVQVMVTLKTQPDGVALTVRDNGRGFVLSREQQRVGHGLMNMRDRAQALHGELTVGPAEGGGTEVRVFMPK